MRSHDAVIIGGGGGYNGPAYAGCLARSGMGVLVLERELVATSTSFSSRASRADFRRSAVLVHDDPNGIPLAS
jgi:2-polyprenyl-6-methoxyphenol hydroxylase-like FAD-dependent oxidoreductase